MNIAELLKEMAAVATNVSLKYTGTGDQWECMCRISEGKVHCARRAGPVMAVMDCYKQFLDQQILERENGAN